MRVVAAALLFLATSAAAQDGFTRILLPVWIGEDPRGANGTTWQQLLTLLNDSDEPLSLVNDVAPVRTCAVGPCLTELPPGIAENISLEVGSIPAALLYVRDRFAPRTALALRIYEQSRAAGPGVQIPIVTDRELLSQPANLLVVQMSGGATRSLLRLYDPDAVAGAALRVQALDLDSGAVVTDRLVPMTLPANRFQPGYAQVPLDASFFPPNTDPRRRFRIRVAPVAAGQRFWAMVSVTDNATNEFTVITPEP
ncbi:MAG TPA: hypothetical protein VGF48_01145 [Thermoanaerobaculia bacterium]|jgi:hypothetical protein